jgi:hypothetical protein
MAPPDLRFDCFPRMLSRVCKPGRNLKTC